MATALAAATVALTGTDPSHADVGAPARPNVLFIAVDDLKPLIGAYGDPHAVTPNIDRLAARGTVFLNAHCQQAVCAPSRVSLLTGLRPDTTRVWDLRTRFRDHHPDVVTLPQAFRQAGYHTAGVGKVFDPRSVTGPRELSDEPSWSEPYLQAPSPDRRTFGFLHPDTVARIEANLQAIGGPDHLPSAYRDRLKAVFGDAGQPPTERADVPDNAYYDGMIAQVAVDKLAELAAADQPFFMAVGFYKPHLPFNAPEKYWRLYDADDLPLAKRSELPAGAPALAGHPSGELRRHYGVPDDDPFRVEMQRELVHGYYACVSFIDAQVGRLLDALDRAGRADDTVVVLWGDHGWHLGDHGLWGKHSTYEQATRSPLIIAAPGMPADGRAEAPVEFVDVYPTLLDLAGIDPPQALQGVSLRPILEDDQASVKDVAVSQFQRRADPDAPDVSHMGYAFRDDRHRYVEWRQTRFREGEFDGPVTDIELYDYRTDPLETRNLAHDPAHADALARMQSRAEAFRAEAYPHATPR